MRRDVITAGEAGGGAAGQQGGVAAGQGMGDVDEGNSSRVRNNFAATAGRPLTAGQMTAGQMTAALPTTDMTEARPSATLVRARGDGPTNPRKLAPLAARTARARHPAAA